MRKFFEGLTPLEGALIFVSVAFGCFFRLYDLDLVSHWSDELATIYFSLNPSEIYSTETHPPLYYLITKLFMLIFGPTVYEVRLGNAFLSVGVNIGLMIYARRIFARNGWILFTLFIFLLPMDIVFARMARMYSILFSLSAWFYLAVIHRPLDKLPVIISFILCWVFPLGFLPASGWILYRLIRERKWGKDLSYLSFTVLPIVIYYLSKFILLPKNPLTFYLGAGEGPRPLWLDIFHVMAGEHYPRLHFSTPPFWSWFPLAVLVVFSLGTAAFSSWRKKSWFSGLDYFLVLLLLTAVFLLTFKHLVISVTLSRYLVFLVPIVGILLGSFADTIQGRLGLIIPVAVFSILINSQFHYPSVEFYPGEREAFEKFQEMKSITGVSTVFCGNKFQFFHYYHSPRKECMDEIRVLVSEKKEFLVLDMNGTRSQNLVSLMSIYNVVDFFRVSPSTVAHMRPKEIKQDRP